MTTTTTTTVVPVPAERPTQKPVTVRRKWTEHGLVFIAPFFLTYALFLLWPLASGIGMSLRSDSQGPERGGDPGLKGQFGAPPESSDPHFSGQVLAEECQHAFAREPDLPTHGVGECP